MKKIQLHPSDLFGGIHSVWRRIEFCLYTIYTFEHWAFEWHDEDFTGNNQRYILSARLLLHLLRHYKLLPWCFTFTLNWFFGFLWIKIWFHRGKNIVYFPLVGRLWRQSRSNPATWNQNVPCFPSLCVISTNSFY